MKYSREVIKVRIHLWKFSRDKSWYERKEMSDLSELTNFLEVNKDKIGFISIEVVGDFP